MVRDVCETMNLVINFPVNSHRGGTSTMNVDGFRTGKPVLHSNPCLPEGNQEKRVFI